MASSPIAFPSHYPRRTGMKYSSSSLSEQILKFADLSPDEINSGWVDGGNDGGIDGFFLFVNDHLLIDPGDRHHRPTP
jgi:hypothetical protein